MIGAAKAWKSLLTVWQPLCVRTRRYPGQARKRYIRWTEQSLLAHLWVRTLTSKSSDSSRVGGMTWGLYTFFIRQGWSVCPNSVPWPVSWAEGRPSQSVPRARAGSETLSYPGAWGRRANTNSSEEHVEVEAEDVSQQVPEQQML